MENSFHREDSYLTFHLIISNPISDTNATTGKAFNEVVKYLVYRKKNRGSVTKIANRLGNPEPSDNEWLKLTPKDKMPQPDKVSFPKPPKAADGSLMYERVPNKGEVEAIKTATTDSTSPLPLKRKHDDVNGVADKGTFKRFYSPLEKHLILMNRNIHF